MSSLHPCFKGIDSLVPVKTVCTCCSLMSHVLKVASIKCSIIGGDEALKPFLLYSRVSDAKISSCGEERWNRGCWASLEVWFGTWWQAWRAAQLLWPVGAGPFQNKRLNLCWFLSRSPFEGEGQDEGSRWDAEQPENGIKNKPKPHPPWKPPADQ